LAGRIVVTALTHSEKVRRVEAMCDFITHGALQGIRLEQVEGEELTLRLPYRAELVGNPDTGVVHGGALTVLLDQTLGIAGLCCDRVGNMMTATLDLRIDHLGVAPPGRDILATARVYRSTRRVLFVEGIAYSDSREYPVARATGSWVLRGEFSPEPISGPRQGVAAP
jgi:uncharacterized protein (TIGR00369 family)